MKQLSLAWEVCGSLSKTRVFRVDPVFDYGSLMCVFFFQAEDGIRDIGVTGVQTCALPISLTSQEGLLPRSTEARFLSDSNPLSARKRLHLGRKCRSFVARVFWALSPRYFGRPRQQSSGDAG